MSEIFISYADQDRWLAETVAKVLEARGWSVWWDRKIPTGQAFDDVIQRALQTAKCVIVLWSKHSVISDWVKTEAAEAKKRQILLPVRIDEVELPLEFRRLQTQSLVSWEKGKPHAGFDQLLKDIARLLGAPPTPEPEKKQTWWQRVPPVLLLTLPTIIVVLIAGVLIAWRIPTLILVDLVVDRVVFAVDETDETFKGILGPVPFRSLTIEKFSHIALEAEKVEVADPSRYSVQEHRFPESAWRDLTFQNITLGFAGNDPQLFPAVTVIGTGVNLTAVGKLDAIRLGRGSVVTIECRGKQKESLTIQMEGKQPRAVLSMLAPFEMNAVHTHVMGGANSLEPGQDSRTYRMRLTEGSPSIEIIGEPASLVLSMRIFQDQTADPFSQETISVTALDFTRQNEEGDRVSALSKGTVGTITYPGYQSLDSVKFDATDILALDGLKRFVIKRFSVDPAGKGIQIRLEGIARHIITKGEFRRDHRLTAFGVLRHNPLLIALFTISVWAFPTTVGGYRLYKDLTR